MIAPPPLWTPSPEAVESATLTRFMAWLHETRGVEVHDYQALWRWSVGNLPEFWSSIVDFFAIPFAARGREVLADEAMPGATWFPGSTLNYVSRVLDQQSSPGPAVIDVREDREGGEIRVTSIGWPQLSADTAALAATLRARGVGPGDRVVGYLPNCYEGVVAFLATASLGAVWASCGLDYAPKAAVDRLAQLDPKAVICGDGYRFGGKLIDRASDVAEFVAGLTTVSTRVWVPRLRPDGDPPSDDWLSWEKSIEGAAPLQPVPVAFDHPLWVLFSSGTTGAPKGMVHGHGGIVVEHVKNLALQIGLKAGERYWWFTSPSWMMWNLQVSGLLVGATIVCYDGSPTWGGPGAVWRIGSKLGVTVLGTSPGYLANCMKADVKPAHDHDLTALRVVGVTGSPLSETAATWLQPNFGPSIQIASSSGGTDVATSFVGSAPVVPVWAGEISAPCLGVSVDAFDDHGRRVRETVGELVVRKPMPSMPTHFWNDLDGRRYRNAYFDMFPGVWRHGDWVTLTDHGSFVIHGRSDSTLNRHGVRMGTGEIYDVVESLPEVREALVLGVEQGSGGYWMPMFVHLADGAVLDDELRFRIGDVVRHQLSPRHVPDDIYEVPAIPHTRTGKKLEVPLKRVFQGANPDGVVDLGAVDRPEAVEWFSKLARQMARLPRRERASPAGLRTSTGERGQPPRSGFAPAPRTNR